MAKTATLTGISFIDNPAIKGREGHYVEVTIDTARILKSWHASLFSFEWLRPDGKIKDLEELSENERPKRADIEAKIGRGAALEKPVLGIGILENVEIGAGRATFLTLAAHGFEKIPVHIPKSHMDEFKDFMA